MKIAERTTGTSVPSRRQPMEAIWRQRADRLAQRPVSSEAAQDVLPVMVLGIGNERYAIDLADVAEVLPPVRPTPVPGAAAVFAGVINVGGEIRPVIDLRRWLGMDTAQTGDQARVILLRRAGREMGLQIDSVEPIRSIGSGALQLAETGDRGPAPGFSRVKGTTKDLLMLLSTEALFAELDTGVTT